MLLHGRYWPESVNIKCWKPIGREIRFHYKIFTGQLELREVKFLSFSWTSNDLSLDKRLSQWPKCQSTFWDLTKCPVTYLNYKFVFLLLYKPKIQLMEWKCRGFFLRWYSRFHTVFSNKTKNETKALISVWAIFTYCYLPTGQCDHQANLDPSSMLSIYFIQLKFRSYSDVRKGPAAMSQGKRERN